MKLTWRIAPVNEYDQIGLEQWMERLAAKGLYFGGTFGPFVLLEKGPRAKVRVRLEPVRVGNGKPDEELCGLYEAAGWSGGACFRNHFQVFYSGDEKAEEPYSDPEIQSYAIGRFFKRSLFRLIPLVLINALVVSRFWFYPLKLLRDTLFPLYDLMTTTLLIYFALVLAIVLLDLSALKGIWTVYRHWRTLKRGHFPDRRRRHRGGGAAVAAAVLLLLSFSAAVATQRISCTYTTEQLTAETPWVTLDQVERGPYKPESKAMFGADLVGRGWNPLAPLSFSCRQWGVYSEPCAKTTLHIDEEYYRDFTPFDQCQCYLEVEYIRCLTPGLAKALFQDLSNWYDYAYGTEIEHPGFDRLIVHDEERAEYPGEHSGAIYGLRGNQVLIVNYSGHESLPDYADRFAAMLEPGAMAVTAQPC